MRHPIQTVLLSAVFSAWVGGCVMLTFVPIENVAKFFNMKWTQKLLHESQNLMVIVGLVVFILAFIASLYDSFKAKKDLSKIKDPDSNLFAITMSAFMYSFIIGILLLGSVLVGRVLSFFIPEPLALLTGLLALLTWLSVTLLRTRRHA